MQLTSPIKCISDNAWMGEAYYFWYDEDNAIFWGRVAKTRTRAYEVYQSKIQSNDIFDTVFNEKHYLSWIKIIEKAAENFIKKSGMKPTLKEINDYFREKGIWSEVDGIMFQDISSNPDHYLVDEFQYKKRIQLAVYNPNIVNNFGIHFEAEC